MLWRRYLAKEETLGQAKRRKEANEVDRVGRHSAKSFHGRSRVGERIEIVWITQSERSSLRRRGSLKRKRDLAGGPAAVDHKQAAGYVA